MVKKNVIVLSKESTFNIQIIEYYFDQFQHFVVKLEMVFEDRERVIVETAGIAWDVCGKPDLRLPLYHSPCGVPATFGKYELHQDVEKRLDHWMESNIPKIISIRLDGQPETFKDRIQDQEFFKKLNFLAKTK